VPISCQNEYASEVQQLLWNAGLYADVDNGPETFKKKIRNGEVAQYNFLLGKLFVGLHHH
jgi:threonyl-tRNA synthetase